VHYLDNKAFDVIDARFNYEDPKYLLKYLASSAFRLVWRIFTSLVCEYSCGYVHKRLSHPPNTTVCYIYVTHYHHSPYKISICGYLGPETTFQNLDRLAGYKGINYRTGFDVFLTVYLSIFILVINQLDAQTLF